MQSRVNPLASTPVVNKGNPLFELNLGDLSCVLTILADYYLIIKDGRRVIAETNNIFCHQAYSYAFRAFNDWPENFYKYLGGSDGLGGSNIYNSLIYRQIHNQCDKKSLHFVIIATDDYIETITRKTAIENRAYPPVFRRFIESKEACQHLKVSHRRFDALIEQENINFTYRWGSRERLIDGERIKEIGNQWSDLLPIESVAKLLRIETHEVKYLVRRGCLKAVNVSVVDGLSEWRFEKEEVSCFIDAVRAGIGRPVQQSSKGLVGAKRIITHLRRLDMESSPFTSEYKILVRALVATMEKNSSISLRRGRGGKGFLDVGSMDVRELAYIGRQLFSRSAHTTLELNETQ